MLVEGCNGVKTDYSAPSGGRFTFPYDGNDYENDDSCFWEIVVPEGETVQLYIIGLDLGIAGETCTQYDYIEVS